MDWGEFKRLVKERRSKRPVWFGLESDPPSSEAEVEAAERSLAVSLPPEYRLFVKEFGGGYFAFVNIFSVTRNSDWNIVDRNRTVPLSADQFVAVSDNGTGDYYGFPVKGERCLSRIVFLDHETGQVNETSYSNLLDYASHVGLKYRGES